MKIAFFDTKPYDKKSFEAIGSQYGFDIKFYENRLCADTVKLAEGADAAVAFVNDTVDAKVIDELYKNKIEVLALRCAGYNNVDFKSAFKKVHILRVPAYSPYAVAEHAAALLLTLNRKIHRAYNRTREHNFTLSGLEGFDLYGKTVGVIGTGKIGRVFIDICRGFNMNVIAYDPYPANDAGFTYAPLAEVLSKADIISLHCPLTKETNHIIDENAINLMKNGAYIINTSRGALIDSEALLKGIKSGKIGAAGLDVYEEESELFFEDFSSSVIKDDVLSMLISMPNVIITSHQAFLTSEALKNIAEATLNNLKDYFEGKPLLNEICYYCKDAATCKKDHIKRCF